MRGDLPPYSSARAAAVLFFLAVAICVPAMASAQACWFYITDLTGAEVVPPTTSTALSGCESGFMCCMTCSECSGLEYQIYLYLAGSLEGTPTALRIHQGRWGENGPLIHEIPLSGFPFRHTIDFDPAYCEALQDTLTYMVIATDRYPEGEIRGQLRPDMRGASQMSTWGRIRSIFR